MHRSAEVSSGFFPRWDEFTPGTVWAGTHIQRSNTGEHRATSIWGAPWGGKAGPASQGHPTTSWGTRAAPAPAPDVVLGMGMAAAGAEVEYVLLEPWRAVSTHKTLAEFSPGSGCLSTARRAVYSWQRHFLVIVFFTLSVFLNNTDKKRGWWQKVAGRMDPSKARQPLRHAYPPMGNKMSFIL